MAPQPEHVFSHDTSNGRTKMDGLDGFIMEDSGVALRANSRYLTPT